MSAVLIIVLLAAIPLIPFLVKILARGSLRLIGWSLQRRTSKRRELIASRVRSEQEAYEAALKGSPKVEDEDWEQIESYAAGTAPNGESPRDVEWDGVVGFFHPFWSVTWQQRPALVLTPLQQCRRGWRTSSVGSYTSHAEALAEGNLRCILRRP
jgi:hypothetical protein